MEEIRHLVVIEAAIDQVYRATTDLFAHCNYHWGFYMRSLKAYCETGEGEPFAGDI